MSINDLLDSEIFLQSIMVMFAIVGVAIFISILTSRNDARKKNSYSTNEFFMKTENNKSTKICSKCGCSLKETANVCSSCGTSVSKRTVVSVQNNEWKCPKCGKINQNYVGTCGCGEVKPK